MPPRKPVRPLQDLTFAASCKLVLQSCQRIEEDASSNEDFDLPFDSDEYKNAVESLRQHLRSFIAPLHWETFFNAVMINNSSRSHLFTRKRNKYSDEITLYSVFVFEDVYLCKFTTPEITKDLSTSCPNRFQFWLKYAKMFPNLLELDFTNGYVQNELFVAFCQSCTKLQVIAMSSYPSTDKLQSLIENCKDLKKIVVRRPLLFEGKPEDEMIRRALEDLEHLEHFHLGYNISSNILENSNTDRKLKLKTISVDLENSNHVQVIANRCPDLETIALKSLHNTEDTSKEIFQTLSSSSLKISKLSLRDFHVDSDTFDGFLSSKGKYITDLSFEYCIISGAPRSFLDMLSKCRYLTDFKLCSVTGLTNEHLATSHPYHPILFPNLEQLTIYVPDNAAFSISLANMFIENSVKMSSLSLIFLESAEINFEEDLRRLFTSPMIKQLTEVSMIDISHSDSRHEMSVNLLRQIIESCPIIKSLEFYPATENAKLFARQLRRVQKKKNLDIKILLKYMKFYFINEIHENVCQLNFI